MRKPIAVAFVVVAGLLCVSHDGVRAEGTTKALAQDPPLGAPAQPQPVFAQPPGTTNSTLVPLEIQVVIGRYQNDKKIASLPYVLTVNANDPENTRLRMGADVAVPTTVTGGSASDKEISPVLSYNYKNLGTSIDCRARTAPDGRFTVTLSISESSAIAADSAGSGVPRVANTPVFRSFQTNTTLLLRDGQTRQFTAATDRITGEVVRVEVTARVLK